MNPSNSDSDSRAERILHWSRLAADTSDSFGFLQESLEFWLRQFEMNYIAVVEAKRGQWELLADSGSEQELPFEELGVVLDEERPHSSGAWRILALSDRGRPNCWSFCFGRMTVQFPLQCFRKMPNT